MGGAERAGRGKGRGVACGGVTAAHVGLVGDLCLVGFELVGKTLGYV